MKKLHKALAGVLAIASVISAASCNGGESSRPASTTAAGTSDTAATTTVTTTEVVTNDTDAAVQELASATEVDSELKPQKKIKWLSW